MNSHTQRQWEGKFFRCGMRCYYCYKPLVLKATANQEEATKEHLMPVSRGGADTIDNIVPACWECNRRKGNMTEEEFRRTFSKAFELLRGVPLVEGSVSALELRNEPNLLKRLKSERDGNVSWMWRNPA